MRRTTPIAGVLVALVLVALVVDVLANGYGDAKLLIQKAEKAFDAGQDAEALELLDEALYTQTTVDKKKEPYGYARYIYYRLSRYWLEKGDSKKAKKYVKKALGAPEDHDWVDEDYWVSAYDPYITKNFPDLSGMKTKKHPAHKVLPACIGLKNGSGDFIYGIGSKKLYRLNRKTLVSQVLYERSHDYLYRFDVHENDDKMLLYYEGDKYLYYLETNPFKVHQIPRGTSVDSLYIDRAGTHAVVYKRGGYRFEVVRTSLAEPHDHETLLEQEGRVLISSADNLLYATWSYVHGKNFHPYYSPMYEHVMARSFSDAKPQRLFTFPNIDHRNSVDRIESRSGEVEGLFLDDFTRNKQYIVVHDWKGGSTITYEVPYRLNADPCGSYCPLGAAFSHKEDHLVILDIQEKQLRVLRFDFQSTDLTETGVVPLPGGSKLKGKVGKEAIHRLGVLEDNSTVWIHWGDYIVFMDSSGKSSIVDVRPFSKVKSPEWAGPTTYTTDPEQFYLGIEKGKGRYFMVVQLPKLYKP